ncbi:MAG: PRC-barrel domain-containing protein [Thermoproteota archaeon]
MLIRKEKIIGLQVYDKKGRYVGTVKDIGFLLGENLVGIVVVGRDNREMEFIWSEVEAAEDIVILRKEVTIPVTAVPKKPVAEVVAGEKAPVKEQVAQETLSTEVKAPLPASKEAEVKIAPKSGLGDVSEIQPSFKEQPTYEAGYEAPPVGALEMEESEIRPDLEEAGKTVESKTDSNTKTCPKCGAINNARYKFCFRCGTRLPP